MSAEGSSYTGGAHGQPLVARFVWLPERQELLTAQALVDSPRGWQAVSDYTRDKLLEQAMLRAQGEDMTPEEQQAQVRNLSKMIDQGTTAEAANFAQFEPVMDAAGRIAALRFVFPPYQVGPYSDGTQTVDVPASVLLPHVAAGYRELFAHP
ncbi:MAG: RsiV family protein [Stenotrophomonas sp.]